MGLLAVMEWIVSILTHASLTGVPILKAPTGEGYSSGIAYKFLDSRDGGNKYVRTVSEYFFMITAFAQGDNADGLEATAKAMNTLLENAFGQNSNGVIYDCQRVREIDFAEPLSNGQVRQNLGAVWRITVKGL